MILALLTLSGLFSDHAVLQRGRANPVWGSDQPRQVVTLSVEGAKLPPVKVQTTAGPDGAWQLTCPELPAGGPYRLHLSGSTEQVIDDIMVGDVWIASGQSNMEFPLARARDADREITSANWPAIRVAKIPLATARTPQAGVSTAWNVCTPDTAGNFTAVGYFFARELTQHTGVPIGIIDSTWGGTRVEAWTSRDGLRPVWPGVDAELDGIAAHEADLPAIKAAYQARLAVWEKASFPADTGNEGEPRGWARPGFDDHAWRSMPLPNTVQGRGGLAANGVFWFRRTFEVPATWAENDLTLSLGAIDDFDTTYFNGEKVGAIGPETYNAYQVPRRYTVPGRLVHAGVNVVAVRVFDHFGDGGFMGPAASLFAESAAQRLALDGPWRWEVERAIPLVPATIYASQPPAPPELSLQNQPAALYNAMIAPLIPYGVRGFIWYQGEANVGAYDTYRARFTALIRDWRTRWGEGTLPFYFVQLAAFTERAEWPYLREAQTQTLAEPGTGMAVTLDIGEIHDIHPHNKQDVGHRLALLARAGTYGEPGLSTRGPELDAVEIAGGSARVRWHDASGLRTHDGGTLVKGFALAGADHVYHAAEARLDGETVVVTCPAVSAPQTVRYGWADYLDVNLENAAGLPAAPFRTDGF